MKSVQKILPSDVPPQLGISRKTMKRSFFVEALFFLLSFLAGRQPADVQNAITKAKRILLFKPDGIGDYILWSQFFQEVARRYPCSKVTVLCCSPTGELVRRMFPQWELRQIPKRPKNIPRFFWMLFWNPGLLLLPKQDLLLDLRPHRASWELLYVILLRATCKVGLQKSIATFRGATLPEERFFDLYIPHPQAGVRRPESEGQECAELGFVDRLCSGLWDFVLASATPNLCSFPWPRPQLSAAGQRVWVIGPFSGNEIRDYPLQNWKEILRQLVLRDSRPDCLLICGASSQREKAEKFKEFLQDVLPVENCCGRLQLDKTAGLLLQSELVFATESALAHLSVALRRPTIAIIGGGHFGLFAPWGAKDAQVHWIWNRLDCFGCNWACIHPSPVCIEHLPVTQVVESSLQLLARVTGAGSAQNGPGRDRRPSSAPAV